MLGVHFAITPTQEQSFLTAPHDDRVAELLEELEESWTDDSLKVDTDKAWDPIHRCLTNGTLEPDAGDFPLSHTVLGGNHLHDDYHVVHVTAAEVRAIAEALQPLTHEWLHERFNAITDPGYMGRHDAADFLYTWSNFEELRAFYTRAAATHRPVLFTAT